MKLYGGEQQGTRQSALSNRQKRRLLHHSAAGFASRIVLPEKPVLTGGAECRTPSAAFYITCPFEPLFFFATIIFCNLGMIAW